jgi:hypothetical protein
MSHIRSDEGKNAPDSIRMNGAFDSDEIDESERHKNPGIAPFRGISIDLSNEDENSFGSIRFELIWNFSPSKSMKGTHSK